jgi:hypothetical protein
MDKTKVADWTTLDDRRPAHALVANVDLVVVRWDDQVSVLYGRCQHRGALMADGHVRGDDLVCGVHDWDYQFPDEIFGDLADAQPAMTHRDDQRAEIMDGADEQRAEYNPKHAGEPTPNDGYGRPEHGGQAGDRGVVMPKQNSLAAGHVVDAVGHRVRRSRPIGVQLENARA